MVNSAVELVSEDPEVAAIVNSNRKEMEDLLCKAIEKGRQSGQLAATMHPRSLAQFFYSNLSGLRVMVRSGADRQTLEDIIRVSLSVL